MRSKRGSITLFFVFAGITAAFCGNISQFSREKIPQLVFTENKGQIRGFDGSSHPEVLFRTGDNNLRIFLLKSGLAYQFINSIKKKGSEARVETFRIDMELVGINNNVHVTSDEECGKVASQNGMNIKHFSRVCYQNIYDGIDWVVYASGNRLKYDFIVHPGADVSNIRMKYKHQEKISLKQDKQLQVTCLMGTIDEMQPVSYSCGKKINTTFDLNKNEVTFNIAPYDKSKTLIVDPLVGWSSYFGDTEKDWGKAVAGDALGNIYVAGSSESGDNISSGGYQQNLSGGIDAFLAKFNSIGTLQWSTYYGGIGNDLATGCVVDGSGNVFLYGETESSQGIASNGFQNSLHGTRDCYLVKFNSNGTRMWATYFGGSSTENSGDCAIDAGGNVYLCGTTMSYDNIGTQGVQQQGHNGQNDAFLAKFSGNGSLLWATYYGGQTNDAGYSCCVDGVNNVYLCGETNSSTYIASNGHQSDCGGMMDAFLAKFSPSGTRMWGTYYGGQSNESGYACCADPQGNVFLGGKTTSLENISSGPGTHQSAYGGNTDAFITKFNSDGTRAWGTYLGGANIDVTNSCIADADGNVLVVGTSVWKFTPGGIKNWEYENLQPALFNAGAVVSTDKVVLCGETETSISSISDGHQTTFGGKKDAVIAVLYPCDPIPQPDPIEGPALVCPLDSQVVYKVNAVPGAQSYQWIFPSAWSGSSSSNTINVTVINGGAISVAATGSCGTGPSRQLQVSTISSDAISIVCNKSPYCEGMKAVLSAQGAASFTWAGGPPTPTFEVSPIFPTTYSVYGTGQNNCVSMSTFQIRPDTTTVFNYTIDGMIAYYSIRNSDCSNFEWDFGNGGGSTINSNPIVNYETPGVYSICLKCGGLPQSCVRCMKLNIPSKLVGGVGLADIQEQQQFVYRNPVYETLEINAPERSPYVMVNMIGTIIKKGNLEEGKNSVQVIDLPKGLYFLMIKQDQQVTSLKILKE